MSSMYARITRFQKRIHGRGHLIGCLSIFTAAFLWAIAYVWVKELVSGMTPGALMAGRFTVSALILTVVSLPKLKRMTRALVRDGAMIGIAVFLEFMLYTIGVQYTEASKASFINASYIAFLPLAYLIIRSKAPRRKDVLCAMLCMCGVSVIMAGNLSGLNRGDAMCLMAAVAYAVHVVLSAPVARKYDTGLLNYVQLTTVAVLSLIYAFVTGDLTAPGQQASLSGIVCLSVICTIIPFYLCLYGMQMVSTATSGILLSFESVMGAGMAVIFLGEPLTIQLVIGGAVVFASFILSEVRTGTGRRILLRKASHIYMKSGS